MIFSYGISLRQNPNRRSVAAHPGTVKGQVRLNSGGKIKGEVRLKSGGKDIQKQRRKKKTLEKFGGQGR